MGLVHPPLETRSLAAIVRDEGTSLSFSLSLSHTCLCAHTLAHFSLSLSILLSSSSGAIFHATISPSANMKIRTTLLVFLYFISISVLILKDLLYWASHPSSSASSWPLFFVSHVFPHQTERYIGQRQEGSRKGCTKRSEGKSHKV